MQGLVESLEGRTFFSSTTIATLLTDKTQISSAEASVKSAEKALIAIEKTGDAGIAANLKGVSPSTNKPLLKQLKTDEAAVKSELAAAVSALIRAAGGATSKSVSAGQSAIKRPTAAAQSKVSQAVLLLQSACTAPLATIQGDLGSQTAGNDLAALVSANSSDTALGALVSARLAAGQTQAGIVATQAAQVQTNALQLTTDLNNISSSTSSAIPTLAAKYTGRNMESASGEVDQDSMFITMQDANGNFAGTLASHYPASSGVPAGTEYYTLTGTVNAAGAVSIVLVQVSDHSKTVTIMGTLVGKEISGAAINSKGNTGSVELMAS